MICILVFNIDFDICRLDSSGKPIGETSDKLEKVLPGFFQTRNKPTNRLEQCTPLVSPCNNKGPRNESPNQTGEPPKVLMEREMPDLVSVKDNDAEKLVERIEQNQVIDFIKPRCPNFITDDVLNNRPFISAMAHSMPKLNKFTVTDRMYLEKQTKKASKTDLSKTTQNIRSRIATLDEKLKQASEIKINVSLGTERLCVATTQKQMILTQVVTLTLQIQHLIESSGVLRKLRKRIAQQDQCKQNRLKEIKHC